ncbi:MAG: ComEC family competence protein, partial [Clostridiales bacterium]|nr:ComEC family competence protein [Clostridiales bacterium]
MIKRPFLWLLAAYLAGILLAWFCIPKIIIIILALLCIVVIYLLIYKIKNRFINRLDGFLWCLPLLFILGHYAMGDQIVRPKLDDMFDDKIECRLSGTISMVVAREWGKILYVRDNRIYLNDEQAFLSKNDGQVSPSENDEQAFLSEKVIVYISDNQDYLVGNSITVFGEIQKFSKATNPGQFNEYMYYNIENIDYKMKAEHIHINDSNYSKFHKILYTLKQKMMEVYSTILEGKESGSLIAMLLGDKYLLDDELKVLYQENGISHILSISGLHISLIGMCIFKMLRELKLPLVISTVISILLIYSYGVFTNFGVSTNRAVVMLIVNLMAKIFG